MQCFVCGEDMRVVKVEPHAVDMQGFELRTFQCVGCGDIEKRAVFDSAQALPPVVTKPLAEPEPPPPPPAPSRMRSILGGLARLRGGSHS
jgi:hypothetical protein